jgi:hypothetical protein
MKFLGLIRDRVSKHEMDPELAVTMGFSSLVRGVLALESANNPARLTNEVFDELIATGLRLIRERIRKTEKKVEAKVAVEQEAVAIKAISELELELSQHKSNSVEEQKQLEAAKREIQILRDELDAVTASRVVSKRLARAMFKSLYFVGWIFLFCGIIIPIITFLFPSLVYWWTTQLFGFGVALFLSILTVFGSDYFKFLRTVESIFEERGERAIKKFLGYPKRSQFRREPMP